MVLPDEMRFDDRQTSLTRVVIKPMVALQRPPEKKQWPCTREAIS